MYEAFYGPNLIARAKTKWGIRRKSKRWLRAREQKLIMRPVWNHLEFRFDGKYVRVER